MEKIYRAHQIPHSATGLLINASGKLMKIRINISQDPIVNFS